MHENSSASSIPLRSYVSGPKVGRSPVSVVSSEEMHTVPGSGDKYHRSINDYI